MWEWIPCGERRTIISVEGSDDGHAIGNWSVGWVECRVVEGVCGTEGFIEPQF